jgi:hypothetical protein
MAERDAGRDERTFVILDGVPANEMGFNKAFPYDSTPQNGRNIVFPK